MRDISIIVDKDGYAESKEHFIANQYENKANRLLFELPSCYMGDDYFQYAVFTLSNGKIIVRRIYKSKCIIDNAITNVAGLTLLQVIVKNLEGVDDLSDGLVMCSQPISCYIKPANFTPENIDTDSVDVNVKLLLDEFDALLTEIRNIDADRAELKEITDELNKTIADISNNTTDLGEVIDARDNFTTLGLRLKAKPYYFNSVADMKACNLKVNDYAITAGYYEYNDGGAGEYKIVADDNLTDDGGSVHTLNNGLKAVLIIKDKLYAKQFGAKGNNKDDDTELLNNFFKHDSNVEKVINQGIYNISDTVFIEGKWRKDSSTDYDNSLKRISFENATLHYTGDENKCIVCLYNHFETIFRGLSITRVSNKGYIEITSIWHSKFIDFDIKCDLKMNYNTSIIKDDIITKGIHSNIFDNINIIGFIYFNTTGTYINSITFKNCGIFGNNIYDYAMELIGETGFQNIKFINCDISYFNRAIMNIVNDSDNARNIKFESCYFDTALPLTEDSNFKGFKIDLINNFDASNMCKQLLYTSDYMKNFNIYNLNSNCNSLPLGLKNLCYNGDFSYIGENKTHNDITNDDRVSKSYVKTDANNSGNALRLEYTNNEETIPLYISGLKAPIKTNYTVACRIIKRSGTGTLSLGNKGQYKHIDLSSVETDKEFILACTPINLGEYDVGADITNSLSLRNGENVIIEIIEMIILTGNILSVNIPLHEKANIIPTADGTLIRPTNVAKGHCYFDTTLNKPIWYNGTKWVDATGVNV